MRYSLPSCQPVRESMRITLDFTAAFCRGEGDAWNVFRTPLGHGLPLVQSDGRMWPCRGAGNAKGSAMREMFKPMIVAACAGAAVLAMSPGGSPFGPQAAFAQEAVAERPRQISVTGQGQVDVAPDMAVVRIGVTHQSEAAAEALLQTSDALTRMLERLTGL